MQFKIITVGRLKEKYVQQGVSDYLKRLRKYARIDILEVMDEKIPEKVSAAREEICMQKEGERVLKLLDPDSFFIVLAVEGHLLSSEELAGQLERCALQGRSKISFAVGGALGLSPEVKTRADLLLSFSPLTFPHQLVRLILLEQLYRAFKINRGEPYHR